MHCFVVVAWVSLKFRTKANSTMGKDRIIFNAPLICLNIKIIQIRETRILTLVFATHRLKWHWDLATQYSQHSFKKSFPFWDFENIYFAWKKNTTWMCYIQVVRPLKREFYNIGPSFVFFVIMNNFMHLKLKWLIIDIA